MKNKITIYVFVAIILLQLGYLASYFIPLPAKADVLPAFIDSIPPSEGYLSVTKSPYIPFKVSFAGEEMPLHYFDVYEKLGLELTINGYWHSQLLQVLKKTTRYFPTIEKILAEEEVPLDFKYLCVAESGMSHVVSPKKAAGFWQILPATAREDNLEVNENIDERYHLEKATRTACRYLKRAYRLFGNWTLAAAAYNMGIAGLKKQVEEQCSHNYYDLFLNAETTRYIYRIACLKIIIENPQKYGFYMDNQVHYPPFEFDEVMVKDKVVSWIDFAKQQKVSYHLLRMFNPWIRDAKLENKDRKEYAVRVPTPDYREKVYKNRH